MICILAHGGASSGDGPERRSGEWRPAAAARNRGLGRSGTPTGHFVITTFFELSSVRPPARARHEPSACASRARTMPPPAVGLLHERCCSYAKDAISGELSFLLRGLVICGVAWGFQALRLPRRSVPGPRCRYARCYRRRAGAGLYEGC